jgi:enediyne biosynthesis protein E4
VLIVDVNGDGKPEVYVANDTTDNFLYVNASRPGKIVLEERGAFALCARDGSGTPNGSMGVDAADYDGSGRPSIWVTNYEGELHALYRNTSRGGRPLFRFSTQTAGIAAIGQNFVGFGTAFVDVDADGWEDLVVSNGHVIRHPHRAGLRQKAVLLKNLGDGRFAEVGARGGPYFRQEHRGRGLAVGDLDNDGRPDLVISHVNEPVALLRHSGTPQRWIGFRLQGAGGADVVGARLSLKAGGRTLVRYARGGGSYLSASDPRLLVGLSDQEQVEEVKVEWPSGEPRAQTFGPLAAGRYWVLPQAGAPRSEAR